MIFMEFEKPLESLYDQLDKIKKIAEDGSLDMSSQIKELELRINNKQKEIYENLTGLNYTVIAMLKMIRLS